MATTARNRNGHSVAEQCVLRIQEAINTHDLAALVDCFASDYASEFPAHLERAFQGQGQLRANWTQIFDGVPDIHAALIRSSVSDNVVWSEWEWKGTRRDGAIFWQRGVTIQGVTDGKIAWARLFIEPVESAGEGAAVPTTIIGRPSEIVVPSSAP